LGFFNFLEKFSVTLMPKRKALGPINGAISSPYTSIEVGL